MRDFDPANDGFGANSRHGDRVSGRGVLAGFAARYALAREGTMLAALRKPGAAHISVGPEADSCTATDRCRLKRFYSIDIFLVATFSITSNKMRATQRTQFT